jgi:hypothetical protein
MASYPIPEWLKPRGDPGAEFTAAYHAGASVAMEQQRLQAERERSAMQAAERAQIAQQDALVQQQKIEVDKAYNQAQIGLRKQQLDQAQQKIAQTAQSAARRFQAQSQIKSAIAAGMPADEAYLKFGADAFTSMAGVAPLIKQHQERVNPFAPSIEQLDVPGTTNKVTIARTGPNTSQIVRDQQAEGPIQSQPVLDPQGNPIPGMVGIPSARGSPNVRNVPKQSNPAEKELLRLEKLQDSDVMGQSAAAADEKSLSKFRQIQRKTYTERQARIDELKKELQSGTSSATGKRFKYNPDTKKLEPVNAD